MVILRLYGLTLIDAPVPTPWPTSSTASRPAGSRCSMKGARDEHGRILATAGILADLDGRATYSMISRPRSLMPANMWIDLDSSMERGLRNAAEFTAGPGSSLEASIMDLLSAMGERLPRIG